MLFRYFQLRDAAAAQFPRNPILKADPIEDLLALGGLDKSLSALYSALLYTDIP